MLKRNEENLILQNFKKGKSRKIKKIYFKGIILGLVSLLLICTIYSLFTPHSENVLVSGARKVLASVGVYTEEIKSVEIKSDEYDKQEAGSWHINKSADWIGLNKAQIKFDLNTVVKTGDHLKDVIFVLDISGSMSGDKLSRVKEDTKELINYLLYNSNNRVALITFDSSSTILSEFSNDKDKLIELIDSLSVTGCTNYNIALSNVDKVLKGYTRENNRDLVTLFLTDGYPNEDTPNQIATYKVLKDKYPYMLINGVQYEMGKDIIQEVIDISDNQFIADMESLNNVLFEATITPEYYESFEVVDYIDKDHWYIESESDIKVSKGHVRLEEENGVQKIVWSFGTEEFKTGESASMTIDVKLQEKYAGTRGFYPTNEKETINYKLPEEDEVKDTSNKTPVLKSWYEVIYDANVPSTCTIDENYKEEHYMYETVIKDNKLLTCDGYIFKGWEISTQGVKKINDDIFEMPSEDVTIRGIWTKPLIAKSMDGEVKKKLTLYKQVQDDAIVLSKNAKKYTGATDTFIGDKDIYYYYGSSAKNNVIFGNYCWKIVRTTDTGGVKLLYNGVPSAEGTCNNTDDDSSLTGIQMGESSSYGSKYFNSSTDSMAYVGYMYNKAYTYERREPSPTYSQTILSSRKMSTVTTNYYYSDTYDYRSGKYYLFLEDNTNLALQIPWTEIITDEDGNEVVKNNYEDLVGKYTCFSSSENGYCSTLYYIVNVDTDNVYYIYLNNGNSINDNGYEKTITLSSEVNKNEDGTYVLSNPVTIEKKDWYTDYSKYKGYYTCGSNELDCTSMKYITETKNTQITYLNTEKNYKYANSFVYDQEKNLYTLVDTDVSLIKETFNFPGDYVNLKNTHYTCWNISGSCSTLFYIYYVNAKSNTPYYIKLTNGNSIEDAINEMLYNDDVNAKDSDIKIAIDYWYEHNMTDYTEYLEDTYWCNDRTISSLGGWNPNGGSMTYHLFFKAYNDASNLTCINKNDRFTINNDNGNGKLTYPVGLLTKQEQNLAYVNNSALSSGNNFWTISPRSFAIILAGVHYSDFSGSDGITWYTDHTINIYSLPSNPVNSFYNVRPSISLRAGIDYIEGDGTIDKPYIIDTNS